MIGILIATHGNLSIELLKSCEMIIGQSEKVKTMSLNLGDTVTDFSKRFCQNIKELDDGDGVLVFTDIYGGSPFNVAAKNMRELNYECISGVNLAMTIETLTSRNGKTLEEVKATAMNVGIASIRDLRKAMACQRNGQ